MTGVGADTEALRPLTRGLWHLLEPLHALLYYTPEVAEEAEALGLPADPRWPSYFPLRAAPMGDEDVERVVWAFYSFAPAMVREHVPWAPDTAAVLDARLRGIDRALRAVLGDMVDGAELAEAANLARAAARVADVAERPLAQANAALPWPAEPHLVLWHAATILREHRGDGHVMALQLEHLDPVGSLVSFASVGAAPREVFASRGWTEDEWEAGLADLVHRGLAFPDGSATPAGHELRDKVEARTDDLAVGPVRALGSRAGRLAQLLKPVTQRVVASKRLPMVSTLGIRRPDR